MRHLIFPSSLVFILTCACSSSSSDPLEPASIGTPCTSDGSCSSLAGSFCSGNPKDGEGAPQQVCTMDCVSHADCGCPAGTTNTAIASGACTHACVKLLADSKSAKCVRTCTGGDCGYTAGARCSMLFAGGAYGVCVDDARIK